MSFDPYPPSPSGPPPGYSKPSSHLVWGILTTLFCCLPFGIVSIVNAAKVDSLWFAGRTSEAMQRSESAKTWAMISAGSGVVVFLLALAMSSGGTY